MYPLGKWGFAPSDSGPKWIRAFGALSSHAVPSHSASFLRPPLTCSLVVSSHSPSARSPSSYPPICSSSSYFPSIFFFSSVPCFPTDDFYFLFSSLPHPIPLRDVLARQTAVGPPAMPTAQAPGLPSGNSPASPLPTTKAGPPPQVNLISHLQHLSTCATTA